MAYFLRYLRHFRCVCYTYFNTRWNTLTIIIVRHSVNSYLRFKHTVRQYKRALHFCLCLVNIQYRHFGTADNRFNSYCLILRGRHLHSQRLHIISWMFWRNEKWTLVNKLIIRSEWIVQHTDKAEDFSFIYIYTTNCTKNTYQLIVFVHVKTSYLRHHKVPFWTHDVCITAFKHTSIFVNPVLCHSS